MQALSLRFTIDDDGDTQLRAAVETPDFTGIGYYWLPAREMEAFCEALSRYPIPLGECISGRWYEDRLTIDVAPTNAVGDLNIRVRVADFTSEWNVCQVMFRANYGDTDRFRGELRSVISAGEGVATLGG